MVSKRILGWVVSKDTIQGLRHLRDIWPSIKRIEIPVERVQHVRALFHENHDASGDILNVSRGVRFLSQQPRRSGEDIIAVRGQRDMPVGIIENGQVLKIQLR